MKEGELETTKTTKMASEREYFWLVVFEWSHKTLSPFQIHVYNPTFTGIIPQEWIVGKLIEAH